MKNKFNAHKTKNADSRKEARRLKELQLLEKAGVIQNLQTQVQYLLIPSQYKKIDGKRVCLERSVKYIADFVYTQNGKQVVEDVKGYKKGAAYNLFVIKRKLMLQVYGIKILET